MISSWTPFLDERLAARWFTYPNLLLLAPVPLAVAFVTWKLMRAIRSDSDVSPFYWAEGLFLVTFVGVGVSTYPYIVPHTITIRDAAAPRSSLLFLLAGTVVLLPVIVAYTAHSYWVFKGKVQDDAGYH